MQKITFFYLPETFCDHTVCQKCVTGLGSALDPTGGAHDAPHNSLVGWEGGYLPTTPHATPRSSRLLKCCTNNLKVTANIQQYAMTTEPYVCKRNGLVVDYTCIAKYQIVTHSLYLAEIGCRK